MPDIALERNGLLATLSRAELQAVAEIGLLVTRPRRAIVCEARSAVKEAIFPLAGIISLVVPFNGGRTVETGVVGREGVFGAMAAFGIRTSQVRAIVQLPLTALAVPADTLHQLAKSKKRIFDLCISYNEALLNQARITAACNAVHPLNARFCRWLLQSSERADADVFEITQASISELLGVRRTSVTETAVVLQKAGVISYSRGKLSIVDRPRLQAMACECSHMPVYQPPR